MIGGNCNVTPFSRQIFARHGCQDASGQSSEHQEQTYIVKNMAPVADFEFGQDKNEFEASELHEIPANIFVQASKTASACGQDFGDESVHMSQRRQRTLQNFLEFQAELVEIANAGLSPECVQMSRESTRKHGEACNISEEQQEHLLDITLRTMLLIHHNQKLQAKLAELRVDANKFLQTHRSSSEHSED